MIWRGENTYRDMEGRCTIISTVIDVGSTLQQEPQGTLHSLSVRHSGGVQDNLTVIWPLVRIHKFIFNNVIWRGTRITYRDYLRGVMYQIYPHVIDV